MKKTRQVVAAVVVSVLLAGVAHAGPPFVNLEGVGGIAFNPLAYPAVTPAKDDGQDLVAKPRIGAWYVNLNSSDIDWFTVGVADTFFKRLELSYGYESVNLGSNLYTLHQNVGDARNGGKGLSQNVHKSNIGAKLLLLEENSFGTNFVPALAVGTVFKTTTFDTGKLGSKVGSSGFDAYLVATKLITQLPKPVLLSVGGLYTQGQANGILGFSEKSDVVFFGNIDVLPLDNAAVGFEYKQGPSFGASANKFKNADYWNVHAAWLVNPNLTLIAAYAYAGSNGNTSVVGLGGGPVVSVQYAF